ncbi:MAG TPA: Hsp20/alpha crystallin family protein [Gammaproteobacteria bacterium]
MNPFEQIKRGLFDTWESVAAGWHELWQRAGAALTRFHPATPPDETPTEARIRRESSPWAILAAEVSETDEAVDVCVEIPGIEPGDFEIDVVGDTLVVRGEKKIERRERHADFSVTERAYGRFERRIRLPAHVDDTAAKASYKRGLLRVHLPKLSKASAKKKIEVEEG